MSTRHRITHEFRALQHLAERAHMGDVDAHEACREIAERLGHLYTEVLDAIIAAHLAGQATEEVRHAMTAGPNQGDTDEHGSDHKA